MAFGGRAQADVRPGGAVISRHLRGARCAHGEGNAVEPDERLRVEDETGIGQVADHEAKVSSIGSGTVGASWRKDVVHVMKLNAGTRAYIQVSGRQTARVRFARGQGKSAKRPCHGSPKA